MEIITTEIRIRMAYRKSNPIPSTLQNVNALRTLVNSLDCMKEYDSVFHYEILESATDICRSNGAEHLFSDVLYKIICLKKDIKQIKQAINERIY